MDSPDLTKLRRFALIVALVLITLVVAQVRLKTPVEITPLGIPLIIARPNLLTVALVIASIYATLRFIYYGMLLHPSPMRARRDLPNRVRPMFGMGGGPEMAAFNEQVQREVDRYFPSFGKHKVTFGVQGAAEGWRVVNMHIPDAIRTMSWVDTVDFLLPIIANVVAIGLWLNGGLTMSVGTGLFLGLLCFAAVFLYTQTKDSGRWRFFAKWVGGVLAALLVAVLVSLSYFYVRSYIESRPRAVVRYANVSLGDSKEEVLYERGSPSGVLEDATGGPAGLRLNVETAKIPSGKRVTDYKYWEYESPDAGRVDIDFSPTTQRVVRVFCYATDNHECPSLLRISGGMSEDQVLNTLGAPSQAELSTENILPLSAVKVLSYAKFKIAFYLEQRRVYGLELGARQQQPATRVPE